VPNGSVVFARQKDPDEVIKQEEHELTVRQPIREETNTPTALTRVNEAKVSTDRDVEARQNQNEVKVKEETLAAADDGVSTDQVVEGRDQTSADVRKTDQKEPSEMTEVDVENQVE